MARLFLSYAVADSALAMRLVEHLTLLGHSLWFDQREIAVGDWIPKQVARGVHHADFLLVIVSRHSFASRWVEFEVQLKTWQEITSGTPVVLPILTDESPVPEGLQGKRCADFRRGYETGLAELAMSLERLHWRGAAGEGRSADTAALSTSRPAGYTQETMFKAPRLTEVNVELSLPYFGKVAGIWTPDDEEQRAAWELYVELATRISTAGLAEDDGLLRESLSSLYAIFTITRDILRRYGPAIARPRADSSITFGYLAIGVLNFVLRPVLAKWHPLLLSHEAMRDPTVSVVVHERQWEHAPALRDVLTQTRGTLAEYSDLLAQVAGVPPIPPVS